jgi:hypothetical protein
MDEAKSHGSSQGKICFFYIALEHALILFFYRLLRGVRGSHPFSHRVAAPMMLQSTSGTAPQAGDCTR